MFQKCNVCGRIWESRDEFLCDPLVVLKGYQVHFKELTAGFFLFNHEQEDCCTTFSIEVKKFSDMYSGPIFETKLHGTNACAQFCLHPQNLTPCPKQCECSFVRNILDIVQNYKNCNTCLYYKDCVHRKESEV